MCQENFFTLENILHIYTSAVSICISGLLLLENRDKSQRKVFYIIEPDLDSVLQSISLVNDGKWLPSRDSSNIFMTIVLMNFCPCCIECMNLSVLLDYQIGLIILRKCLFNSNSYFYHTSRFCIFPQSPCIYIPKFELNRQSASSVLLNYVHLLPIL